MGTSLHDVLYDPFVGKVVSAILGIAILNILLRFLDRRWTVHIREKHARYSLRVG